MIAVLSAAALATAGVAAYARYAGDMSAAAVTVTPSLQLQPHLQSQDFDVAALGRIEPESEIVNLGAGVSPDRLDTLLVKRGDLVKQGQVLGYLGGYPEQVAQRDVYSAQLAEARSQRQTESALDQARIDAAVIQRQQILEITPLRIAAQQSTIISMEAKLTNDRRTARRYDELLTKGTAARQQADDLNSLVDQEEASLKAAEAQLQQLQQQYTLDQQDADTQVMIAQNVLARMQAGFPVDSLQRQMELAEARAKQLSVISPIDGRVLDVRIKPGEEVGSGPILVLGDTAHMRAVAEVYETDVARVRVGQKATISGRALASAIPGEVVRVGDMVFKNDVLNVDPAARADARVVQVWIELDDAAAVAKLTNLTVDVLIHTDAPDRADASSKQAETAP
ncbi:MAG TPA: efflux RND transporter periplasmic adaptor subunit [Candidatus Binatia bacterium]|nr:efflux RND transporter periplasmic adaptor subunit [Candidatus Binatia bacterium]